MINANNEFVGHYDWTDISPPTAVVEALTEAMDRKPDEIDALYHYIDPDALETLVSEGKSANSTTVSFRYDSRQVTVKGSGEITISPADTAANTSKN